MMQKRYTDQKICYEKEWSEIKGKTIHSSTYKSNNPLPEIKEFINFLKKNNINGNVLDIGCGNGRHSILFAESKYEVTGIDYSKSAINIAKKNAKNKNLNIRFETKDLFSFNSRNVRYDIIIDCGCLHHQNKNMWGKYITRINDLLKPQGYYFLYCFSIDSEYIPYFSPFDKQRNWTICNGIYNHFFSQQEIEKIFSKQFIILQKKIIKHKTRALKFNINYMKKRK